MTFEDFKGRDEIFRAKRKIMVDKIKEAEGILKDLRGEQLEIIKAHENLILDLLDEFQEEAKEKWPDYKPPKFLRVGRMGHGG